MRSFVLFSLLAVGGAAQAQSPSWDGFVATARAAWQKTVDAGRPLAERIARETPGRFRLAKKQAMALVARAEAYAKSGDLEGKRALAAELWRVRGSLDLMAMLNPQTLKLFGIDVPDLARLRADVNRQLVKLRA